VCTLFFTHLCLFRVSCFRLLLICHFHPFFFRWIPPPPFSTLFPYTTLFRSLPAGFNPSSLAKIFAPVSYFFSIFPTSIKGVFPIDRKSTRLNSSHVSISYAVFCLKKKKRYK